jgi:hypothetical protein
MSTEATQAFKDLVATVVEYHEAIFAVSETQEADDANQERVDRLYAAWLDGEKQITPAEKALVDEISARLTWARSPKTAMPPISEALQAVLSQDWAKTLREALTACQEAGKGISEGNPSDAGNPVPPPNDFSAAFHEYAAKTVRLMDMIQEGTDETDPGDIRESMDAPWGGMSLKERKIANSITRRVRLLHTNADDPCQTYDPQTELVIDFYVRQSKAYLPPSVPIPTGTTDGWESAFVGQNTVEIVNEATDAIKRTPDDLLGLALLDYKATERDFAAARIRELEAKVAELEAQLSQPRGTIPGNSEGVFRPVAAQQAGNDGK